MKVVVSDGTVLIPSTLVSAVTRVSMHEIQVCVASREAADHGVAELTVAGELISYTVLDEGDLMLHIEPRSDHSEVVVGARSLAQALIQACRLLEQD